MAEINVEPAPSSLAGFDDFTVKFEEKCNELKGVESLSVKPCSLETKEDQEEIAMKREEASDNDWKEKLNDSVRTTEAEIEEKSVSGVKVHEIVKSEPSSSQEKPQHPTFTPNSRPVHYVIVPSPNGAISKEKLQRFGLLCKSGADGIKATVTIQGNNVPLKSSDNKKMGADTISNLNNGFDSQSQPTPTDGSGGKPEALEVNVGGSGMNSSATAYVAIQPGAAPKSTDPENRLPGTSLVYRTPGANNINKNGKVKRPMNAFMVWARMYRAKMAEAFPNTTNSDVSVRLGQVWHEMTAEQKKPFYAEAERIKQRHKLQYPEWSYTPSPARRRPESPPPESTVAHNVYWARYAGGSMNAVHQAANYSPTNEPTLRLGSIVPQAPINQSPQQLVSPVPCITNVYTPVPVKPLAPVKPQTPAPASTTAPFQPEIKQETEATIARTAQGIKKEPETGKPVKGKKHVKNCPLSNVSTQRDGNSGNSPACTCSEKDQSKRQRKPRTRKKDKTKAGEDGPDGPRTNPPCQQSPGKPPSFLPPPDDGTLCLEDDYPSDPYNPFYFLNLGAQCDDQRGADDVDVDRWRTYLGDSGEGQQTCLAEPDYNLDVFLSEARVSGSTTSVASSDIDIVPAPLASTLDRLQKSGAIAPKTKGHGKRSGTGGSKVKPQTNRSSGGVQKGKSNSQCSAAGTPNSKSESKQLEIGRIDTPRPKTSPTGDLPNRLSPQGSDLFVINEEIVVTTPQIDHVRLDLVSGLTADSGGAGDSISYLPKSTSAPTSYTAYKADVQNEDCHFQDVPTISPPGKKPCVN